VMPNDNGIGVNERDLCDRVAYDSLTRIE
jgi:hypothetical protein